MGQDLLHTINEDAQKLSEQETYIRVKPGAVPDSEHQAWLSTIRDWNAFFSEEVNRGLLSSFVAGASEDQLKTWQRRFDDWRIKIITWTEASKKTPAPTPVAKIVEKNLPTVSAETKGRVTTRKQEDKQDKEMTSPKLFGMPVWMAGLMGIGGVVAAGYVISSAARFSGK